MMRITAGMALLSLFAIVGIGCVDSPTESSCWLFLCKDEPTKDSASPTAVAPAPEAQTTDGPAGEPSPAVLFVAYVATPPDVVDAMLKLAHVGRSDVVCDLGCGDGRILVTAAKRYGCRAVGYDLDGLRVQEARKNARDNHVAGLVHIEQQDILRADLSATTVVTLYLGSEMNDRLVSQLVTLGAGVRIVSHDAGLADIPPDQTVQINSRTDSRTHTIYLWNCPLHVGQVSRSTP